MVYIRSKEQARVLVENIKESYVFVQKCILRGKNSGFGLSRLFEREKFTCAVIFVAFTIWNSIASKILDEQRFISCQLS